MTQRPKQPPVKHAEKMRRKSIEQKHLQAAKGGRIDVPFLLLVLLLTIIGLVMLFSASFPSAYYETGTPTYYFKRQAIYAAVGLAGLALAARFNYQRWRGASRLLLILSLFLLMLVIIPGIGIKHNNARRWLGIDGVFTFQPSEIAKLAVIVYFADSISKKREKMLQWREGIVPYAVILGVFSILMMLRWLIGAGVGGVAAVAVLFVKLVEGGVISYGASRIAMWHDPWLDTSKDGYQMVQSLIAIGSGGLLGLGFGKGRQKFMYLPEEHNDFIFAIVCEELGLVGACIIMLIFAMLLVRGFWIALHARDRFGTLLVVGIMTQLGLQVFLNIAVVSGLVPATGISLPFFSYGGTALALQLGEMGIVLSVSRQIPAPRNG